MLGSTESWKRRHSYYGAVRVLFGQFIRACNLLLFAENVSLMNDLRPQLTFNPEDTLQIVTGLDEHYPSYRIEPEIDARIVQHKRNLLELVGEDEGVEASEDKGVATISVDLEKRFNFSRSTDFASNDVEEFVRQLSEILPFHPVDGIDRVFGLEYLSSYGASGVIYQQFQLFLNSDAITEDALRHAALAMAIPFGNDISAKVKKDLQVFNFGDSLGAEGFSSRVHITPDRFGLYKRKENDRQFIETIGSVEWRWLNISTLGSCACWGTASEERA